MNITLLILYILTITLCIVFRKRKSVLYLAFLMAWILIAGNFDNADYANYEWRYGWGLEVSIDIGFSILCNIFNNLGFDYQIFKGIISFLCLFLIFRTIKKLSLHPTIGAAFFLIYPFLIDITQFRNFVSYSVVFAAIPYLFDKKRVSTIKYVILVLTAASIHASSIFYMVFVLSKIKVKGWQVLGIVIVVYMAKEALKNYFLLQMGSEKLEDYTQTTTLGAIAGSLVVVINYFLIWFVHKNYKKGMQMPVKMPQKAFLFCTENIWLYCNMLIFIIIPFIFDNGLYSRIYRNIVVLNMIFVYNAFYINRSRKVPLMVLYYAYLVFSTYFAGTYTSLVFEPVFRYNSYFNIL